MPRTIPSPLVSSPSGRVCLRPVRPDDIPLLWRWDRDPELLALYGGQPSEMACGRSRHALAVDFEGRLVGLVGLSTASLVAGSAEIEIVIGDEADRGRGLGRAALHAFLGWAFSGLHIEFVLLRVLRGNARAVKCFESCGFRPAGVLRVRADSRYADPPLPDDILLMIHSGP